MTEEEALARVHSIGTAFDNDYNDGDGPDYEGVTVETANGHTWLNYSGTTGEKTWAFRWLLIPVPLGQVGSPFEED
jgi:hypothetical protein